MKSLYLLSFLLVVAAVSGYDTAHDDFDYTQVTSNPYLLKEYNHCYIDTGPCNEISGFFKPFIQEIVFTACAQCTPAQKKLADKYLEALERYFPEEYELFKRKYDPYEYFFRTFRAAVTQY